MQIKISKDEFLQSSDAFRQRLAGLVSGTFSMMLFNEVGEENFHEILRLNAEESNSNICHSGDFCDSNMVMLEAIRTHVDVSEDDVLDDISEDGPLLTLWGLSWVVK